MGLGGHSLRLNVELIQIVYKLYLSLHTNTLLPILNVNVTIFDSRNWCYF